MTIRFGFVSTYPPTICGLATFTAALFAELVTAVDGDGRIVRVVDTADAHSGTHALEELVAGDRASGIRAAQLLNGGDVCIVQHEYGAYGGPDGDEILPLLAALRVPSIVVLHTVLSAPTPGQRSVLEAVVALADAVVTMTTTARDRLASYDVDMRKVTVIPHGAPSSAPSTAEPGTIELRTARPTILSYGLIGPGKGIEWGIAAMAALADLSPAPLYVIAGQTHPKVLARDGELYRNRLVDAAKEAGVSDCVLFDGRYRDTASLTALLRTADVVLLPYDSTEQVTSGVLIEAVAALKPVVATRFPHAVELLSDGAGILVPHRDPAAIAAALRTVLTRADVAADMARAAGATARTLRWSAVADRYRDLASSLIANTVSA